MSSKKPSLYYQLTLDGNIATGYRFNLEDLKLECEGIEVSLLEFFLNVQDMQKRLQKLESSK